MLEQDMITVDVKGAVKSPGIHDFRLIGSRINDAVQKAGGLTDNANLVSLSILPRELVTKHWSIFR